ncbi:helix-turn-helix domain-containing protein [Nocardia takedensis]
MTGSWTGDWQIGRGRVVLAGHFGSMTPHHHPAVQITVALAGKFVAADDEDNRTVRAVVIPSGVRHALRSADDSTRVLSIYLHPTSPDARLLASAHGGGPADWMAAAEAIEEVDLRPDAPLDESAEAVLTALRGDAPATDAMHPTLRNAFDLLTALVPRKLYLGELAAAVSVSQSSLSRLFVSETGVGFPATVRWARLLYAMGEVGTGASITDAAHAAGFTDSAHATRVCREMTGVPPSVLVRAFRSES